LLFYIFSFKILSYNLSSGSNILRGLGEVRAHVALEVEVGKLIGLLELKKGGKLGVRVDLTTVVLVLKLLVANVSIHLASHLGASKNTTLRLAKEGGELVGDQSRLDKSRRSTVGAGLAALIRLICGTKLASVLALQLVDLGANGGKNGLSTLKLGKNTAVESGANGAIELGDRSRSLDTVNSGCGSSDRGGDRGSLGSSGCLRHLGSGSGSGRSSRARNSRGRRNRLDHVIGYTHMNKVFLSCF
jgi:hypothetical protein